MEKFVKKSLVILFALPMSIFSFLTGAATLYDSSPELTLVLDDPIVITRLSSAGVQNLEQF